jgi:hypothetical protein
MAVPQGFMVCGWESTKSVGQRSTGWGRRHFDSESIVRLNRHCKPMIFVRESPVIECGMALAENNPVDKLNSCTPFSSSITVGLETAWKIERDPERAGAETLIRG